MKQLEEGMILYHGSYCVVENPDLQKCAKYKDFGQGFYLTTSKEQAKSFAKITATKSKARGLISVNEQFGHVSFFKVNDIKELKSYGFETADKEFYMLKTECASYVRTVGEIKEINTIEISSGVVKTKGLEYKSPLPFDEIIYYEA